MTRAVVSIVAVALFIASFIVGVYVGTTLDNDLFSTTGASHEAYASTDYSPIMTATDYGSTVDSDDSPSPDVYEHSTSYQGGPGYVIEALVPGHLFAVRALDFESDRVSSRTDPFLEAGIRELNTYWDIVNVVAINHRVGTGSYTAAVWVFVTPKDSPADDE
ncbi:MAG: hypothetical protein Q8O87_02335 [bacterium]|nr:hypothetical protein [bacterium]